MMTFLAKTARIRVLLGFVLLGVLFVAASIFLLTRPKVDYLETDGIITEINETYNFSSEEYEHQVIISYTVDGARFDNVEYGSYSSSMKVGDVVTVLYDPNAPDQIQAPGFEVIPYVLGGVGLLAIIIPLFPLISYAAVRAKEKKQEQ